MAWDESQRASVTYRQARIYVREKRTKLNIALRQWQLDKSLLVFLTTVSSSSMLLRKMFRNSWVRTPFQGAVPASTKTPLY